MVRDINNDEGRYKKWRASVEKKGIEDLSKQNSNLIIQYLDDMKEGKNIARGSKKGARSYARLNVCKTRVSLLAEFLEERGVKDVSKVTEDQITELINDLNEGVIKRKDGQPYERVVDFIKNFKAFYHWHMKVKRKLYVASDGKEGAMIPDITEDLDTSSKENKFVYFTYEQLKRMMKFFNKDVQVRMLFMFDTIIRSPKELQNVKVSDLHSDYTELSIREETSKTYGRTIKLLLCSEGLKKYVERNKLKPEDYLFTFDSSKFNKKMKEVAVSLFKDENNTKGGKPFSSLSMYDYRHSGACYWRLGAYKSKIDALMYRGGWSDLTMLNYYTKKLGMKDSIEKEDLLINVDKTKVEELEEQIRKEKIRTERLEKEVSDTTQSIKELTKTFELLNTKMKSNNQFMKDKIEKETRIK